MAMYGNCPCSLPKPNPARRETAAEIAADLMSKLPNLVEMRWQGTATPVAGPNGGRNAMGRITPIR